MALSIFATGLPVVLSATPYVLTKTPITLLLDGSSKSLTVAGSVHGGPTGGTPEMIWFQREGGTATDELGYHIDVTGYDTTNNEVDYKIYLSDAGTGSATIIFNLYCLFTEQATGGVS